MITKQTIIHSTVIVTTVFALASAQIGTLGSFTDPRDNKTLYWNYKSVDFSVRCVRDD